MTDEWLEGILLFAQIFVLLFFEKLRVLHVLIYAVFVL